MQCVGAKIDNGLHEKVIEKCNDQGCTVSEYLRELILKDLDTDSPREEIPKVKVTSIDDIPVNAAGELQFEGE